MWKKPKKHKQGLAVLLLMFCAVSLTPVQATQNQDWTMEQLMAEMAQVKTARARFTEIKYLQATTEPDKSSGTLLYKAPHYIERRVELPQPSYFISRKNTVRMKNPGQKKEIKVVLYQFPPLQLFVDSMRGILSGDIKTLKQNFSIRFSGKRNDWTLELIPSDDDMLDYAQKIEFRGNATRLSQVVTIMDKNNYSSITISDHSD